MFRQCEGLLRAVQGGHISLFRSLIGRRCLHQSSDDSKPLGLAPPSLLPLPHHQFHRHRLLHQHHRHHCHFPPPLHHPRHCCCRHFRGPYLEDRYRHHC